MAVCDCSVRSFCRSYDLKQLREDDVTLAIVFDGQFRSPLENLLLLAVLGPLAVPERLKRADSVEESARLQDAVFDQPVKAMGCDEVSVPVRGTVAKSLFPVEQDVSDPYAASGLMRQSLKACVPPIMTETCRW